MSDHSNESTGVAVWNRVLKTALGLPGARVDREVYLRKELSKVVSEAIVQKAIETTPAKAGIPSSAIRAIAQSSIKWHRAGVSSTSFVTGLPGGWWIAGTVPADLTQFFWHVLVVLQKLAYLHGWPQLFDNKEELDDETLLRISIFVGVMLGAANAGKILGDLAERFSAEVVKRLPEKALTKWGLYNFSKQVAKWIGVKLTKESFARTLSRAIPVISGFLAGGITWVSFSTMSKRLRKHLESLRLHTETS